MNKDDGEAVLAALRKHVPSATKRVDVADMLVDAARAVRGDNFADDFMRGIRDAIRSKDGK